MTKDKVMSIILIKVAKAFLGLAGVIFGLALTLIGMHVVTRSVE